MCVLQEDNVNKQENEVATKQTPVDVKRGGTTLGRLVGIMSRPVGQSEPSRTISTHNTTHNAQYQRLVLYVGQHSSDTVAIIRVVELGARGRSGPAYLGEGISDIPSIPAQSIPTSYPSIPTSSP